MVKIKAPTGLITDSSSVWYNTSWMDLDVDRVDFSINNDIKVYQQINQETTLNQMAASTHIMVITGHVTNNSDLVGSSTFLKVKNLILIMREWYYNLTIGGEGFSQINWENLTWDFLPQKVMVIDSADSDNDENKVYNYQLSAMLIHED